MHGCVLFVEVQSRAVYRNFAKGGQIWSMDKRGGGGAGRKLSGIM